MSCERSLRFQLMLESLQNQYDDLLNEVQVAKGSRGVESQRSSGDLPEEAWLGAGSMRQYSMASVGSQLKNFSGMKALKTDRGFLTLVGQKESLKEQLKATMSINTRANETYKKSSCSSSVVMSTWFRFTTLAVIVANAILVAVDLDLKLGVSDSGPGFSAYHALQSIFCAFFVIEWTLRLAAFQSTWDACKEVWYLVDGFLAIIMVMETVVLPWARAATLQVEHDPYSLVVISRLTNACRCLQVGRVTKFVHLLPETKALMTCVFIGARGVSAAGLIVVALTYCFAVLLQIMSEGSSVGENYFHNFLQSLFTLLLLGVVPEGQQFIQEIEDAPWYVLCAVCLFVVIVQVTIMNLLIGLLCKVVENVADADKEARDFTFLKATMSEVIAAVDADSNGRVSKAEMLAILENPNAVDSLHHVGIDVVALVDGIDVMFEVAGVDEFEMDEFVQALQPYKASTNATVAVIKELREVIFRRFNALEKNVIAAYKERASELNAMRRSVKKLTLENLNADFKRMALDTFASEGTVGTVNYTL